MVMSMTSSLLIWWNEIIWVPLFGIEFFVSLRWLWQQGLEILMQLVNSHLSHSLVLSGSNIYFSSLRFLLSSNQYEVPLSLLIHQNFLVQSVVWVIDLNLVAQSVKVKVNTVAVIIKLLRYWHDNALSRWNEERPFSSDMLYEYSHEAFNRSKNCSVNNDWSWETWFDKLFLPFKIVRIKVIGFEQLGHHDFVLLSLSIGVNLLTVFVLQIESNR